VRRGASSGSDQRAAFTMPSQTTNLPPSETIVRPNEKLQRVNTQTIEERAFQVALIMIEGHFTQEPPIGRKTAVKAMETIKRTMDKTLNMSSVRYEASVLDILIDVLLMFTTIGRPSRRMLIFGSASRLLLSLQFQHWPPVLFEKPMQRPSCQALLFQKAVL
jgi:hypothetical protein